MTRNKFPKIPNAYNILMIRREPLNVLDPKIRFLQKYSLHGP